MTSSECNEGQVRMMTKRGGPRGVDCGGLVHKTNRGGPQGQEDLEGEVQGALVEGEVVAVGWDPTATTSSRWERRSDGVGLDQV